MGCLEATGHIAEGLGLYGISGAQTKEGACGTGWSGIKGRKAVSAT